MVNRKAKAKTIIKIAEKPCKQCGKPTAINKICLKCRIVICDECARFSHSDKYCLACHEKIRALYKLA